MKIYHKEELNKGYVVSDKIHHNKTSFEVFSISNFGIDIMKLKENWNKQFTSKTKEERKSIINILKSVIMGSVTFKDIVKEGYHKAIYLNINYDGIDCFISR